VSGARRRWRWRLTATACAAALSVLSSALPAMAAGAVGGPFGLSPWPNSHGKAAAYFTLNLAAGQSATESALISNGGQTMEKLIISRSTGVTAANGGSSFSHAFQPCSGAGCWVTGLPAAVTLPVDTGEKLQFTVSVPPGTAPGQYLAGITAEAAAKPKPVKVGSNGKATGRAIIIEQVTIAVAVTVGPLSRLTTRLEIPGVSAVVVGSMVRLNIDLANTGRTFAHGAGQASCTVHGVRRAYSFYVPTVLPHDRAVITAGLPRLAAKAATMPCTVRIGYGSGLTASWSGTVTVPSEATSRIVRTGPGDYSVIPVGGIPAWATAMIVIGVLLLAAAVVLIVRMRGRRQTG